MDHPKLRYVDAFPVETEHGQMIAVRDPSGISEETLVLSPDAFYLLRFFDGSHSLLDLQTEYTKAFGQFLPEHKLREIVTHLNEHLYLENDYFDAQLSKIKQAFLSLPARPAAHAGQSYAAEPEKLMAQIDGFFRDKEGAGLPDGANGRALKGLLAPHIDIRAGGPCYSHAYRALAESAGADCFVILGTGHSGLRDLYSTVAKDFETPLGLARCDRGFIEQLTANYPRIANSEPLPHKSEHVIEFQLVFLKYLYEQLYKDGRDFTFVPLLCSFSYHASSDPRFAREKKIVEEFTAALRRTIAESGKRVCLLASVDFCHVGLRYGDEVAPDDAFLQKVKAFDTKMIEVIESADAANFSRMVTEHEDRYRVCGYSSIYTMLEAMDAKRGQLLNHSDTEVDNEHSTVTFASMAFE